MKFQDSSFNGLKVTVGTKSVTHPRTHPRTLQKQYHGVQRRMISVDNMSKINLLRTKMADF